MTAPPPRWLYAAVVALFVVLWSTTATRLAPSGDAATVWSTLEPSRTVLCVEEGRLHLAGEPTEADRAAVHAELVGEELRVGPALHRDHTYRAVLSLGGVEVPWMKNDYTSALPEWLPHLAFRLGGTVAAGRVPTALMAVVVLLLTMACAARVGGPGGAAIAGLLLATDPAFHAWKKVLAGPEVWLQLCAIGAMACVLTAAARRTGRPLVPAALLLGLGLHVKPTFAAAALPLVLASVPLLRARRVPVGRRTVAVCAVVGLLGVSPSLAYWASRPGAADGGISQGSQENARGRVGAIVTRWTQPPESREERSKGVSPATALLSPTSWHAGYWAARADQDNDPRTGTGARPAPPPVLGGLGARATLFLAGLAVFAALRRRGEALWAVGLAALTPLAIHGLHPDPHHLALALPALAVALAAAAKVPTARGARAVVTAMVLLAVIGRGSELARLDAVLDEHAGRTLDVAGWEALGAALERQGATSVAALEYEVLGVAEAFTGGRVRPFQYARSGRPGCLAAGGDAWLGAILEAHAGGHLLVSWGTSGAPTAGGRPSWVGPDLLRRVARSVGLGVAPVDEVTDPRGRWVGTLYGITGR